MKEATDEFSATLTEQLGMVLKGLTDFSVALTAMKVLGFKAARKGWNCKGLSIGIKSPAQDSDMTRPYTYMTIPKGSSTQINENEQMPLFDTVPWLPSQTDLLAEDWYIVQE